MEPTTDALAQFLELGFAAAGTLAGGFFIVLLLKYILESVVGQASSLHAMITALDLRVKTMNNEERLMRWIDYSIDQMPDGSFRVEGVTPTEVMDKKDYSLYRPGDIFVVNQNGWLMKVEPETVVL